VKWNHEGQLFRRWQEKWFVCVQYRYGIYKPLLLVPWDLRTLYIDRIYFSRLFLTPPRSIPTFSLLPNSSSRSALCNNPLKSFMLPINSWALGKPLQPGQLITSYIFVENWLSLSCQLGLRDSGSVVYRRHCFVLVLTDICILYFHSLFLEGS